MTAPVRALVARMLWNGLAPTTVAHSTGEPLADVLALAVEIEGSK